MLSLMSFPDLLGRKNRGYSGFIYSFLAVIFLSPVFILMNEAVNSIGLETANVIFFLSGFAFVLATGFVKGTLAKSADAIRKQIKPVIAIGALNSVQALLFFLGLKMIGPSAASFIARTEVVFVVVMGALLLKEKLGGMEFAGISMTFAGAAILTFGNTSLAVGSLVMLFSTFLISLQNVLTKKYAHMIRPFDLNLGRLGVVSVVMLIYSVIGNTLNLAWDSSFILAASAGVLGPAIGFYFLLKGIEAMDVSKVITIRSLEPFAVIIMSTFVYGLSISPTQAFGGVVMVVGVTILAVAHRKHSKKHEILDGDI